MCANAPIPIKRGGKRSGYGYKVFIRSHYLAGQLLFMFRSYRGARSLITGDWLKAEEGVLHTTSKETYTAGFHIYTRRQDAIEICGNRWSNMCVVRVQYRGAHTTGYDYAAHIVVARYMRVAKKYRPIKIRVDTDSQVE